MVSQEDLLLSGFWQLNNKSHLGKNIQQSLEEENQCFREFAK